MFGAEQFAKMKDGVRLINTARGGIYQTEALIEALESRQGRLGRYRRLRGRAVHRLAAGRARRTSSSRRTWARAPSEAQDRAGEQIAEYVARGSRRARWSRRPSTSRRSLPRSTRRSAPTSSLPRTSARWSRRSLAAASSRSTSEFVGALADVDTRILKHRSAQGPAHRGRAPSPSTSSTPTTTPSSAASTSPRPSAPRRTTTSR